MIGGFIGIEPRKHGIVLTFVSSKKNPAWTRRGKHTPRKGNYTMHYYSFHIGDYRAATAHLSNEEDLAYRRLLDMYYDSEQEIPLDTQWVSRRIRVDIEVVEIVLNDMFQRTENGWKSQRCDDEIARYRHNAEKNKLNGSKGGRPRKNPVETQWEPKQKATNNHKPITNNQENTKALARVPRFDAQAHLLSLDVDANVANDFLALRKQKRATLSLTAINGIQREAAKANITLTQALEISCARGWQSFKADWIKNETIRTGNNKPDWAVEKENRIRAFAGDSAAKPQDQLTGNIIDITPQAKLIGG